MTMADRTGYIVKAILETIDSKTWIEGIESRAWADAPANPYVE